MKKLNLVLIFLFFNVPIHALFNFNDEPGFALHEHIKKLRSRSSMATSTAPASEPSSGFSITALMGTLGAVRMIASLSAFNTGLHAYTIVRMHELRAKMNKMGKQLRDLTGMLKKNHQENIAEHVKTRETVDHVVQEQQRLDARVHQKMDAQHQEVGQQFETVKAEMQAGERRMERILQEQLKRADGRDARRLRRYARVFARHQDGLRVQMGRFEVKLDAVLENQKGLNKLLARLLSDPGAAEKAHFMVNLARRVVR